MCTPHSNHHQRCRFLHHVTTHPLSGGTASVRLNGLQQVKIPMMKWQRLGPYRQMMMMYPRLAGALYSNKWLFGRLFPSRRTAYSASRALPIVPTTSSKGHKKKATKKLKTAQDNLNQKEILALIQDEHKIFKKGVKRVIDLGCAPGNWMVLCRSLIRRYNQYNTKEFSENCLVLGIDMLFVQSNQGISMLQGNILSKDLLLRAKAHCKEVEYKQKKQKQKQKQVKDNLIDAISTINETPPDTTDSKSFHNSESINYDGILTEESVDKSYFMEESLESQAVEATESTNIDLDYKVDVILSDLGPVIYFQPDFWNNTSTRPYARFAMSEPLRQTVHNNNKGCIDTADAALVYCCELLRPGGSLVLRLPLVWRDDPELSLLESRLNRMFKTVVRQDGDSLKIEKRAGDVIYICKEMGDGISKTEVFEG